MNDGSLTADSMSIGCVGRGTFKTEEGNVTVEHDITLGSSGSRGSLWLTTSDATVSAGGSIYAVGGGSDISIKGGSLTAQEMHVGSDAKRALVSMDGGSIAADVLLGSGGEIKARGVISGDISSYGLVETLPVYSRQSYLSVKGRIENHGTVRLVRGTHLLVDGGIGVHSGAELIGEGVVEAEVTNHGVIRPDAFFRIEGNVANMGTLELPEEGDVYVTRTLSCSGPNASIEFGTSSYLYAGALVLGGGNYLQDTGKCYVNGAMGVGAPGDPAAYRIDAAILNVGRLDIGRDGPGALDIQSRNTDIIVRDALHFGSESALHATAGSTIHMTGSAFENESTDPGSVADLANLTLVFEGGEGVIDPFEVAGRDFGLTEAGFVSNFALGTLQLGGDSHRGFVRGQYHSQRRFPAGPEWSKCLLPQLRGHGRYD